MRVWLKIVVFISLSLISYLDLSLILSLNLSNSANMV